jgi:glycosyltransferase involved in cell wall biosynthesis
VKIIHHHRFMNLERGGIVRCIRDLCESLAAAGHEITVLTADARNAPDEWKKQAPGCPHVVEFPRSPLMAGFFVPFAMRRITPLLREADVLHLHGMWDPGHVQLAAAARKLSLPYIYSAHGHLADWSLTQRRLKKRAFLAAFGRKLLRNATAVHCTAEAELEQARKWFPQSRGVVIPLILDVTSFRDLPGPGPARARFPQLDTALPLVLFLSRLHYKKGVEQLIHAADRLRRDGQECLVLIAGTGDQEYERQLKTQVEQHRLEDRVLFLGFVSGVEKISLYQVANAFVLPTYHENFGFVLFEALAAATPVVTTHGADTWPELLSSGGALIVEQTADAFGSAIKGLIQDPDQFRRMGEKGREWVFSFLDSKRIVDRFESLYSEVARTEA